MTGLPTGTVTMLFTDIERSTSLVHELEDRYAAVLGDYRRLLRSALSEAGGHEIDCRADELFAAFPRAKDGLTAAVAAQRTLGRHRWPGGVNVRVRMGLHTGEPAVEAEAYFGFDVHRAVRICSAGHGGQILLSQTTRDLVVEHAETRDLGMHALAGLPRPERIFQLIVPQMQTDFPPLRVESAEDKRRRSLPSASPRELTLVEAAWRVLRMLPDTAVPLQDSMVKLGAALFTADRALTGADGFLALIDTERLTRRLAEQRPVGLSSPSARERLESLQAQAACIELLVERRRTLGGLASDLAEELNGLRTVEGIGSLRERVVATTEQLDEAFKQAARALDPMSYRLTRTRRRGIYRSGHKYVVPYLDEVGNERQREFETSKEARNFRLRVRTPEPIKQDVWHRVGEERVHERVVGVPRNDRSRKGRP
jgi:class 3 adenylate cyclase